MKEEPSDELIGLESHGLLFIPIGIVPPAEGDIAVLDMLRIRLLLIAILWVYLPRYLKTPSAPSKGGLQ